MNWPYELQIGWRYTRAGRAGRRNAFISFISGVSMLGIALGVELARAMGVREGDKVTIVAPGGQVTPAGVVPRLKQLTLVGTFDSGHYEYDSGLALIHVDDAARLFRVDGPTGVQLRLKNVDDAREVAWQLQSSFGH